MLRKLTKDEKAYYLIIKKNWEVEKLMFQRSLEYK